MMRRTTSFLKGQFKGVSSNRRTGLVADWKVIMRHMSVMLVLLLAPLAVTVLGQSESKRVPLPPTMTESPHEARPDVLALTELEQLRLQVHTLKLQLAQRDLAVAELTAQLKSVALTDERETLSTDILKTRPGYSIDWATLKLVEPKQMPKLPIAK